MKSAVIATAVLSVLAAHLNPAAEAFVPRASDRTILNFALTLEHLEDAFYKLELRRFSDRDFRRSGFPAGAYEQLVQVGKHETEHVLFLEELLGNQATKPCTYKFPVNNPTQFAQLSQVFENVGVGAYTGAIASLSKQYITDSASILGTEARQASLIAAYINGVEGWGGAWNAPLTMSQAYHLASPFIVSCPSDNPPLPVRIFPNLTFPSNPTPGTRVTLQFQTGLDPSVPLFAVFLSGTTRTPDIVPVSRRHRVTIPADLAGQVYCIVSTSPFGATDRDTVAGPALLQFNFDLTGQPAMKA